MAVAVILTIASRGLINFGSGTSSTLTSVTPFQQTAFMRLSFSPLALVLQIPSPGGHWQGMILLKPAQPIPAHAHVLVQQLTSRSVDSARRVVHPLIPPHLFP